MNVWGRTRDAWGTLRSAGALTHPRLLRMAARGRARFRAYARPLFESYVQSLCPAVDVLPFALALRRLGIDSQALSLSLPDLDEHGLGDWERVTLAALARRCGAHPAFEIGTAAGSTALLIALNTRADVFTLDLPGDGRGHVFARRRLSTDDAVVRQREHGSALRQRPEPRVVALRGDSATFDFAPWAGRIGLVFVDGAHSRDYVRADTRSAARLCRDDGVVAWHDFGGSRDVSSFLDALARRGAALFGVERTTLALCADVGSLRRALAAEGTA